VLKVSFEEKEGKITLTLKGHAGQADIGHDIVCASCSILAYTVAQIVKYEGDNGGLKAPPKIMLEKGEAVISCEPTEERYAEILHSYYVAEVGYTLLAHNYPQFVDLTMFGTESNP
jgi:uncharacterized protein YsxB (DUF464 family)